jgi:protein TonB
MAAVDLGGLQHRSDVGLLRWAAAAAVAVALHAAVFVAFRRAPEPPAFESQAPIELDLLPPPSGAAQLDEAGVEATSTAQMETAEEITPEETPTSAEPPTETDTQAPAETKPETQPEEAQETPPETEEMQELTEDETPPLPQEDAMAAVEPDKAEPVETTPLEETEILPDVATVPPDVTPAVTLPPERTVTAREPEPEPKPKPKEVARKPVERPQPVKREPAKPRPTQRTAEVKDKPSPSTTSAQAGGRGGVSADRGAARAAASAYATRIRSLVAGQRRCVAGVNGLATVSFTVTRSGRLAGLSAAGAPDVSAAAKLMVQRASGSFPPMPPEMTGNSARYNLPISLSRC